MQPDGILRNTPDRALLGKILDQLSDDDGGLPFGANSVHLSNFTANDDPQTVEYKKDGVLVKTITLTYDGSNRLTSATFS